MENIITRLIQKDKKLWSDVAGDLVAVMPNLLESYTSNGFDAFLDEQSVASRILGYAMGEHYADMLPHDSRLTQELVGTRWSRRIIADNPLLCLISNLMIDFYWQTPADQFLMEALEEAANNITSTELRPVAV